MYSNVKRLRELQRHVEYNIEERGINVDDVAPADTSQLVLKSGALNANGRFRLTALRSEAGIH
jgi:hypothetical protein